MRRIRMRPATPGLALVAATGAVLGLALRVLIMTSSLTATDSDEAVVALIGHHAAHGTVDVMFWGQAYGGTIEALLAAPLYRIFGPSPMVGRIFLLFLSALTSLLTWRVGRRLVGPRAAVVAGALAWTTSAYFVWWSTKINIYFGALALALSVVLLLLQLRDGDAPRWWPIAFGLASGAALWSNPQTMLLIVPAGALWIAPLLRNLRRVAQSIPFVLIGASPWLAFSVRNQWKTLKFPGVDVYLPYPTRVLLFFRELPIAVGTRTPFDQRWLVPSTVHWLLVVAVAAALVIAAVRGLQGARELVFLVLAYAVLFGLSPQVGEPGANVQPRYLTFVLPVLLLALAKVVCSIRWKGIDAVAAAVVAASAGLSASGLHSMVEHRTTLAAAGPGAVVPSDLGDLRTLLREHDVHDAYAFYWLSFRTTFETRERVIVTPAFAHLSRYAPYAARVEASPNPAVVVLADTPEVAAMERMATAQTGGVQTYRRGRFALVIPAGHVDREAVAAAFRDAGIFG